MKKIIILLMAVSIMLTSCGKSAGLSNIDKKAGNKTSVASPSPKPQPQKNNETGNKTPVASPSPKPQPQKIDNDDIEQSWKDYAYDPVFATGLILLVIVVGFVFKKLIDKKNENPFKVIIDLRDNNNLPPPSSPENLKSLPEPILELFRSPFMYEYDGDYADYPFAQFCVRTLVAVYHSKETYPAWLPHIKNYLAKLYYDVSTLN
jgi:hypothetical protein